MTIFFLTLFISYLILPMQNFIADIVVRSLAIIIIFGGFVLLLNVSDDVTRVTESVIKRIKNIFMSNS
jgi:hypothetical protein